MIEYFSQWGQDKFVIDYLKEKRKGFYVEIGAYHSSEISNTYILEKDYEWSGLSFEMDVKRTVEFNNNRKNRCLLMDATLCNFEHLFEHLNLPQRIDYLSIDVDPEEANLEVLKKIPLHKHRFSIITIEHDLYRNFRRNMYIKKSQHDILKHHGYKLASDLLDYADIKKRIGVEDWWVDSTI